MEGGQWRGFLRVLQGDTGERGELRHGTLQGRAGETRLCRSA